MLSGFELYPRWVPLNVTPRNELDKAWGIVLSYQTKLSRLNVNVDSPAKVGF